MFSDDHRFLTSTEGRAPTMYVCLCNALTDHHVRAAALAGADRPSAVYRACGCTVRCGTCSTTVRRIVDETVANDLRPDLLAAD
ncbi:MAG TPA: (2Fe-2S)-binding protein [Acetobacteraceae bacterium]|nr:(2Fe-2S)-binding protein [Acetobacteraceae bacterium]